MSAFTRTAVRLFVAVCLAAGTGAVLSACGDSSGTSAQNVDVQDFRYVRLENGNREFTGTIRNSGSSKIPVAQIRVSLYDAAGTRIGTSNIEVAEIPANGEKEFRASANVEDRVARARIQSVLVP